MQDAFKQNLARAFIEARLERGQHSVQPSELDALISNERPHRLLASAPYRDLPNNIGSMPVAEIKQQLHAHWDANPTLDKSEARFFDIKRTHTLEHLRIEQEAQAARAKLVGSHMPKPPGSPVPPQLATPNAAKTAGSWVSRLGKEKWIGKKGLAVVGGTVALGSVLYGAKKLLEHDKGKQASWTSQVDATRAAPPLFYRD